MVRKWIAALLALCMAFSLCLFAPPASAEDLDDIVILDVDELEALPDEDLIEVIDPGVDEPADAPSSGSIGGVTWSIASGCLSIGGSGAIPDYLSFLETPWYPRWEEITMIRIDNAGITRIGNNAFWGLNAVTTVSFQPSGDESVLTEIGDNAFYGLDKITSLNLPSSVTKVGQSAFMFCRMLSSLSILGVRDIGDYAFAYCDIDYVSLNQHLTSFGCAAFEGNPMVAFNIPSSADYYTVDNGILFSKDMATLVAYPCGRTDTSYTVPTATDCIGPGAFASCSYLVQVSLPDKWFTISDFAFDACSNLYSLSNSDRITYLGDAALRGTDFFLLYLDNLEHLGEAAFCECANLSELHLPDTGIDSIGWATFFGCSTLQDLKLPSSVTSISYLAFVGCKELRTLKIPSGVKSIGAGAFEDCDSLNELVFPDATESIARMAFCRCDNLTWVQFGAGLESLGDRMFSDCPEMQYVAFMGSAPVFDDETFANSAVKAFYPTDKSGWTADVRQNYGGTVTWKPFNNGIYITYEPDDAFLPTGTTGETVSFGIGVGGPEAVGYQWYYHAPGSDDLVPAEELDGVTDANTDSLEIPGKTAYDGYQFRCDAWDKATGKSVSSREAKFFFTPIPRIITQPKDQTVAEGETAKFTVEADGNGFDLSYQWYYRTSEGAVPKACTSTGNKTSTLSVKATEARNGFLFECLIENEQGGSWTLPAKLTVTDAAKPKITASPKSVDIAKGETATFTVQASGTDLTYQWYYRHSADESWTKYTGTGNKTKSIDVIAYSTRDGWQYCCKVSNSAGHAWSAKATLNVVVKPTITEQPETVTIAVDKTASFTVAAEGKLLSYQWQYRTSSTGAWKNSGSTGNKTKTLSVKATEARSGFQFRCVVTNLAGSVNSKYATLKVVTKPTITASPKNVTAAKGSTVTFTVKASGKDLKYQWYYRASADDEWVKNYSEGYNTDTLTVTAYGTRNGYQYCCKVWNIAGSKWSSKATLTVVTKPTVTTQPKSVTVARSSSVSFTVKANGGELKYQWYYRTSSSGEWTKCYYSGYNTDTLSLTAYSKHNGYQFRCEVSNVAGSVNTSPATLTVT